MRLQTQKGFTITEVLIVLAILAVIVTIVVSAFSKFNNNQSLNGAVGEVTSILNEARANTLASYDNSQYGVHFQTDKVALFKGGIYSSSDSGNKDIILSSKISVSNITLSGGGSEVIFKRLTGKTEQNGAITLSLISDPSKSKTITIQVSGIIE
jgi:prepilin-type N-terminal cleavage/methylation domain-containing protein